MSSGFKENFEREEKESLDYDDSAFYYFGLAMLLIVLLPLTWLLVLKPIVKGEIRINHKIKNCHCSICTKKIAEREAFYRFTWLNKGWAVKLTVLAVMWYWCFVCFVTVKDIEPLKTFIPHEILGVATDAPVSAVKKAYRKLSREKHPDKNPDNPEAVNEFITITKAYTVSHPTILTLFRS